MCAEKEFIFKKKKKGAKRDVVIQEFLMVASQHYVGPKRRQLWEGVVGVFPHLVPSSGHHVSPLS